MVSIRESVKKWGFTNPPVSIKEWGHKLRSSSPISLKNLANLPISVVFSSGNLGPSTVTGSAELAIHSDGFWNFRGTIHESGFLGHNYAFAVVLDELDHSGKAIGKYHEGKVGGTIDPFDSRDDSWYETYQDQYISDNWDIIVNSGAKFNLHVSTDPIQVLELAVAPLVAAAAVGVVILGGKAAPDGCHYSSNLSDIRDNTYAGFSCP